MSHLDEIDWNTVPVSHPVCDREVEVPTIRVQDFGTGYPAQIPAEKVGTKEVVIQWFGVNDGGELDARKNQFAFQLQTNPDSMSWFGEPESFRVVMFGQVKDCPEPTLRNTMLGAGHKLDCIVAYVISSRFGVENGAGDTRPAAFIVAAVSLGDPMFGIIRPQLYCDFRVSQEEIAKFSK